MHELIDSLFALSWVSVAIVAIVFLVLAAVFIWRSRKID
jgi:uncharacterized membrane protein